MRDWTRALSVGLLVLTAAACERLVEPGTSSSEDLSVRAVSGAPVRDTVAQAADSSLVVEVSRGGRAASGVTVRWSAGAGTVAGDARTDSAGRAQARWTLGPEAGTQRATASVSGDTVRFAAEALPGPVVQLEASADRDTFRIYQDTLHLSAVGWDRFGNRRTQPSVRWQGIDTRLDSLGPGERVLITDTVYFRRLSDGHLLTPRDTARIPHSPGPREVTIAAVRRGADSVRATLQVVEASPIWMANLSPDGVCMLSIRLVEPDWTWHGIDAHTFAFDAAGRPTSITRAGWASEDTAIARVFPDSVPGAQHAHVHGYDAGTTTVSVTVADTVAGRVNRLTDPMSVGVDATKPLDTCPNAPSSTVSSDASVQVSAGGVVDGNVVATPDGPGGLRVSGREGSR